MKIVDYQWEHPDLEPYLKKFTEGSYLFHQGDLGTVMYVLRKGVVELLSVQDGSECVVSWVGAGEFLGEKAILSENPHARYFSARTKREVECLELGVKELEVIEQKAPLVAKDLIKGMFLSAASRLQFANQAMEVLRRSNQVERLIHLILLLSERYGVKKEEGIEVALSYDTLTYYVDLTPETIRHCLEFLEKEDLLRKQEAHSYLITDVAGVLRAIATLKRQVP